jgi:hypothetical protein
VQYEAFSALWSASLRASGLELLGEQSLTSDADSNRKRYEAVFGLPGRGKVEPVQLLAKLEWSWDDGGVPFRIDIVVTANLMLGRGIPLGSLQDWPSRARQIARELDLARWLTLGEVDGQREEPAPGHKGDAVLEVSTAGPGAPRVCAVTARAWLVLSLSGEDSSERSLKALLRELKEALLTWERALEPWLAEACFRD